MPSFDQEIMNIMIDLARQENIRVNITESLRSGLITGISTAIGSFLLGPLGIATGAILGGLVAISTSSNFLPVTEILRNLTPAQQTQLVNRVYGVMQSLDVNHVVALTALFTDSAALNENLVNVLRMFITNDLHYSLAS